VTDAKSAGLRPKLDPNDDELTSLIDQAVDIDQSIYTELENIGEGSSTVRSTPATDQRHPATTDSYVQKEIGKVMGKALRSGEVLRKAQRRHVLEHETRQ
jgi:hypothetical protein